MFGIDFTIAIFSFLFIMAFIQVHQNRMLDEIREERGILLHDRLSYTMDNLLVSEGYPKGWNSSNVVSVGLVESSNVLKRTSLEEFSKLNETYAKRVLGVRSTDFYFDVSYPNGTVAYLDGVNITIGTYPFENATAVFSSSRKAILEGKQVNVNMYLWVKNQ